MRFGEALPPDSGYGEVHELLLPEHWPPTPENRAALGAYIARRGIREAQRAVTSGQSTHADGLFYAGSAPTWSNRSLRGIVRGHGVGRGRIGWIDLHTGLGPAGHGEKIYAGANHATEFSRAR